MAYNPYDTDFSDDIGLGSDDSDRVKSNKVEWYKPNSKGQTDRVALIYFNPIEVTRLAKFRRGNPNASEAEQREYIAKVRAEVAQALNKPVDSLDQIDLLDTSEVRFKAVDASYKDGLGYVQWPRVIDDADRPVWDRLAQLAEKKTYVISLLLVYPTDREGEIDKNRLATGWQVKPWRFSEDKYSKFKKINRGLVEGGSSLAGYDLFLNCQEPQFQKIDITQAGPAIWLRNSAFRRKVLEKALADYPKLNPFKQVTTDELR